MTPNAKIEVYTIAESNLPVDDAFWIGDGWTEGFKYGLDRKEPGELENFKMKVRLITPAPFNLAPGQRVKIEFENEVLLFNLVKIIHSIGGLTYILLDTLP
jgi:hypothetical protein